MKRSIPIDLLRAIAIFLVLGRHMTVCPPSTNRFLSGLTQMWHRGGWIGVDLFFVLSGFLIAGLLFSEQRTHGRITFQRFIVRRGFKIYPGFWALILAAVLMGIVRGQPVATAGLVHELLFVQNYTGGLWSHTWSLAIEEHFYFMLPLFLIALINYSHDKSNPFGLIPWCFFLSAALGLVLRMVTGYYDGYQMYFTHLRIDSLFFGVFLSYFYHYHPESFLDFARGRRWQLLAVGGLLIAPAFLVEHTTSFYIYTVGLTQIYIGSGLVLVGMLGCAIPEYPPVRLMAFIGTRSYSIYLWHLLALTIASKILGFSGVLPNWYIYAPVSFVGAVSFGIAMAAAVENPMLRIRDARVPSPSADDKLRGSRILQPMQGRSLV